MGIRLNFFYNRHLFVRILKGMHYGGQISPQQNRTHKTSRLIFARHNGFSTLMGADIRRMVSDVDFILGVARGKVVWKNATPQRIANIRNTMFPLLTRLGI